MAIDLLRRQKNKLVMKVRCMAAAKAPVNRAMSNQLKGVSARGIDIGV